MANREHLQRTLHWGDWPTTDFTIEEDLEDFWKHRLTIVDDDKRTLIGATEMHPSDAAVLSETQAIAEVATSQVALDWVRRTLLGEPRVAPRYLRGAR